MEQENLIEPLLWARLEYHTLLNEKEILLILLGEK